MQFENVHDESIAIFAAGNGAQTGRQNVPVLMDDPTPTEVSLHF